MWVLLKLTYEISFRLATEFHKRYSFCAEYKLKIPCYHYTDIVDSFLRENGKITYRNRRISGVEMTRIYA